MPEKGDGIATKGLRQTGSEQLSVEMPEKVDGIATFGSRFSSRTSETVEMPEKVDGIATLFLSEVSAQTPSYFQLKCPKKWAGLRQ